MPRPIFLRSRVARRVLGLFFLCAALPTGLLAVLSYRRIATDLEAGARTRLVRESKGVALMLLDRLASAREVVIELARDRERLQSGRSPTGGPNGLRWVAIRGPLGDWQPIAGTGRGPTVVPEKAVARLLSGRAWLAAESSGDIVIAHRLATDTNQTLFAGFDPERFWGTEEESPLRPEGRGLCIRATGGFALHESPAQSCGAEVGSGGVIEGSWTAFLGYEFGTPSWSVSVNEPAAAAFAAVASFTSTFGWVALLTLAIVFALANVQIRRSMTPLDALAEGTRRLSAGDLSHRVSVTTGDEFRLLADSFNGMAVSLDRHIGLLTALQRVNQTALASPTADAAAGAALAALRGLFPDSAAVVGRPSPNPVHPWIARSTSVSGIETSALFRPRPSAIEALSQNRVAQIPAAPGLISDLPLDPGWHSAVAPLRLDAEMFGFVLLTRASLPYQPDDLARLAALAEQTSIALANAQLVERLDEMSWGSLKALARTIDAVSPWTAGHSEHVTVVALEIASAMRLPPDELELIHRGGLLHDIGKIGIPAAVLEKPGPLTPEERAVIERHPLVGVQILRPLPVFSRALPLIRWHHEALDGRGYPDRLVGDQIPINVRILTVADVWDALTSERPYRPAWSEEQALTHLRENTGTRFDPNAVSALSEIVRTGKTQNRDLPLPPTGDRQWTSGARDRPGAAASAGTSPN